MYSHVIIILTSFEASQYYKYNFTNYRRTKHYTNLGIQICSIVINTFFPEANFEDKELCLFTQLLLYSRIIFLSSKKFVFNNIPKVVVYTYNYVIFACHDHLKKVKVSINVAFKERRKKLLIIVSSIEYNFVKFLALFQGYFFVI